MTRSARSKAYCLAVASAIATSSVADIPEADRPSARDCQFDRAKVPAPVASAAAAFRSKPHGDRRKECRLLFEAKVFPIAASEPVPPNGWRELPNRVSCLMTRDDLTWLLGKPTDRKNGNPVYLLSPPSNVKGANESETYCKLEVSINAGLVGLQMFSGAGCPSIFEGLE